MLNHLAIIMDGNGRWAKSRHLPRTAGHKKGAESARIAIKLCAEFGIKYLTLYTFSIENWNRPQNEVSDLMNLFGYYLGKELGELNKNNVKVNIIGDKSRLTKDVTTQIQQAEELTRNNDGLILNIALSYGSRQEITNAALTMAKDVAKGVIKPEEINEQKFSYYLYTRDIPDPDFLIRTGGEERLSNFLLWQSAYTEFYFTDSLWPDFDETEFRKAIDEFHTRERRYGSTKVKKVS